MSPDDIGKPSAGLRNARIASLLPVDIGIIIVIIGVARHHFVVAMASSRYSYSNGIKSGRRGMAFRRAAFLGGNTIVTNGEDSCCGDEILREGKRKLAVGEEELSKTRQCGGIVRRRCEPARRGVVAASWYSSHMRGENRKKCAGLPRGNPILSARNIIVSMVNVGCHRVRGILCVQAGRACAGRPAPSAREADMALSRGAGSKCAKLIGEANKSHLAVACGGSVTRLEAGTWHLRNASSREAGAAVK